jgi:hypothetical protein
MNQKIGEFYIDIVLNLLSKDPKERINSKELIIKLENPKLNELLNKHNFKYFDDRFYIYHYNKGKNEIYWKSKSFEYQKNKSFNKKEIFYKDDFIIKIHQNRSIMNISNINNETIMEYNNKNPINLLNKYNDFIYFSYSKSKNNYIKILKLDNQNLNLFQKIVIDFNIINLIINGKF